MKHARDDYFRIQDPWNKIPEDEPVFLIRGQDLLADAAMQAYSVAALDEAKGLRTRGNPPAAEAMEALARSTMQQAQAMREWGTRKLPDLARPVAAATLNAQAHAAEKAAGEPTAKRITRQRLETLGVHEHVIAEVFARGRKDLTDADSIRWDELVCMDGMMAVAALEEEDLFSLTEELREQGAPIAFGTPAQLVHYLYAAASLYVPDGPWARRSLQSAVAACLLLKLAQEAWTKKRVVVAQQVQ